MFLNKRQFCSIFLISLTLISVKTQDDDIFSNLIDNGVNAMENLKANFYFMENKIKASASEKVDIKLYYESMCSHCKDFNTVNLKPTVKKLALYLDLHLHPYGRAQTIDKGNGEYDFKCRHGPNECYGNKLHLCAVDYLANISKAVFFNSCMMESSRDNGGSNDDAADACGKEMNVDPEWIKKCAKGPRGNELLKNCGDETKKVDLRSVPYILINEAQYDRNGGDFMKAVCAAFKAPPPECSTVV